MDILDESPILFLFFEAETQISLYLLRIKADVPGTANIVTIVFLWRQRTGRWAKPDGHGGNTGPPEALGQSQQRPTQSITQEGCWADIVWAIVSLCIGPSCWRWWSFSRHMSKNLSLGWGLTKAISACGEGSYPFSHQKCGLPGDYELMYLEQC